MNGTDWATTQVCPGGVRVWPHSGYWNDSDSLTWDGSKNIGFYVSEVVGSSATANTVRFGSGSGGTGGGAGGSILLAAPEVVLRADGMLFTNSGHTIGGPGTLTTKSSTGPSCLFLHGVSGSSVTISSSITDNGGGPVSLRTKEGLYVLDAPMHYTGDTLVGLGTLRFTATGRLQDGIVDIDREGILDLAGFSKTIGGLSGGGSVTLASGTLTVGTNNLSTTFGGGVSGAGGMTKVGDGALTLTGESTLAGPLVVKDGEVVLAKKFRLPLLNYAAIEFASINVEIGAAGYRNNLSPTAPLLVSGGEIEVKFGTGIGKTDIVDLGVVNVNSGGNNIDVHGGGGGSGGTVRLASVNRDAGTNVNWNFEGGGSLLIASPPTMTNGIIGGWATRSTDDGEVKTFTWATMQPDGSVGGLTSFEDSPPAWGAFVNGRYVLRAGVPLRFDANSLVIQGDGSGDPSTLTLDTGTSVITTGGLLATGVSGHEIAGVGSLTSATNELIVHVPDAAHTFRIGAETCDQGGGQLSLIKAGAGTLELTGASTYSGPTIVNEGTLVAGSSANLGDGSSANGIVLRRGKLRLTKSPGAITLDASQRTLTIDGPGVVDVDAGDTLMVGSISGGGEFTKIGDGVVFTTKLELPKGNNQEGVLRIAPSGGSLSSTSVIDHLTIGETASVDLTDNKLIVSDRHGHFLVNQGVYDGVAGLVQKGRGDGTWNGLGGIVTSMSDATGSLLTTIACATGAEIRGLAPGETDSWAGQGISADSVLLMYTWGGDADLNGELNGDDYFFIDSSVLQSGSVFGFHNGDFDYNGEINGDDYFIIDSNILQAQASGIVWPSGAGAAGLTSVPEPAALGTLAIAGLCLARHRRGAC